MKEEPSKSKFKKIIILVVVIGAIVFGFKMISGGDSVFTIESGSGFGTPTSKKQDRNLDEAGHTDDFWTSGRFKW